MTLRKPKYCKQDWLAMKPTNGGRICGQCQNKVVDFSKMSWNEIVSEQGKNNNALCGMYSNKQLKYWGQEPPKIEAPSKPFFFISTILLTLGQITSKIGFSKSSEKYEILTAYNSNEKALTPSADSTKTIIYGTVLDSSIDLPLISANVYLEKLMVGAATDIDGKYRLEIENKFEEAIKDKLIISFVGYRTKEISLDGLLKGELNRIDVNLKETAEIIVYHVYRPSIWGRTKGFFRKLFRFNRREY